MIGKNEWKKILPPRVIDSTKIADRLENTLELQEVRLRVGYPIYIKTRRKSYFLKSDMGGGNITKRDIQEMLALLSGYSLYAFEEELRQGYITLNGGHRVGFCGRAVIENGTVKTLRQISSVNIRIASEVKGCATPWIPYLFEGDNLCHTLIVSPPGCGKTTLLRDIIRQLSEGWRRRWTVGVVDERGEIAAMKDGEAQMDIGPCTDVQENVTKTEGMLMLLRSMAPDVIAVDELGKKEDFAGVEAMLCAGVILICTVHGSNMAELAGKPYLKEFIHQKTIGRYVFLSKTEKTGTVAAILDGAQRVLYRRGDGEDA